VHVDPWLLSCGRWVALKDAKFIAGDILWFMHTFRK